MNHKTLLNICAGLLLLSLIGCHSEDLLDGLTLRSNMNEKFYHQNNEIAAKRLATIMYNTKGSNRYERFKIVHISDAHLSNYSPSNHFTNPINLKQSILFANLRNMKNKLNKVKTI